MKRKDISLIAIIAGLSAFISLVVSNLLFTTPSNRQQQVEVVQPITSAFPQPDSRYFNKDAFDPTQQITIGQEANTDPFSGSSPR